MLQAYALTADEKFLHEAKTAIRALREMRFELVYQTNLTAWGAVACVKLWKTERDQFFLDHAQVFIAGFLHNCEMWESEIDNARYYRNFLGATCLHDGPYMAAYECFESFAAFDELLRVGGSDLSPAVRTLLCEYNRYALDRAWFFYPDALPHEILSDKVRNGHIDCTLSFPLEDLYGDGQPAGQVGQEIYGCGGVFTFETRAFHRFKHAPFMLFSDYPASVVEVSAGEIAVQLLGPPELKGRLRVIPLGRRPLPRIRLRRLADEVVVSARGRAKTYRDYQVAGDAALDLRWSVAEA
ncbi:MAG: hypothetical protein WAU68_12090 [Vitreimonas sp.]